MNIPQEAMCRLLRAALFETGSTPDFADVPAEMWPEVYRECRAQAVAAVPANMLNKLHLPAELYALWKRDALAHAVRYQQLIAVQAEMSGALAGAGVQHVILKGVASAQYYPVPWLRAMGDIDVLVKPEQMQQALQALLALGCLHENPESGEKRHHVLKKSGVTIELHRGFFAGEHPNADRLDQYLYQAMDAPAMLELTDQQAPVLPDMENGLVLLQHISQHLNAGLGMRQIVDWLMFVKARLNDAQWPAFQPMAAQAGLEGLAMGVTRLGQMYLGLDQGITWCQGCDERACTQLLEYFLDSGNFGSKQPKQSITASAFSRLRSNFFHTLQSCGERNWQALKRWPWLRPFAWIYQAGRYVHLGLKGGGGLQNALAGSRKADQLAEIRARLHVK